MIKTLLFVCCLAMTAPSFSQELKPQPPAAIINISMVLKVSDKERVFDHLVQSATDLGGYFSYRSEQSLQIRLPVAEIALFKASAKKQGTLVDFNQSSQYKGNELLVFKQRLFAKNELLNSYVETLAQSSTTEGVLLIEEQVLQLTSAIEQLKRKILLMENQLKLATITIDLQFRDRSAPVSRSVSSFPWLNTMNLMDLLEDFR